MVKGNRSNSGRRLSEEQKEKIRQSNIGKHNILRPDLLGNKFGEGTGNRGATKGKHYLKISESLKGSKHAKGKRTEEQKQRMRDGRKRAKELRQSK